MRDEYLPSYEEYYKEWKKQYNLSDEKIKKLWQGILQMRSKKSLEKIKQQTYIAYDTYSKLYKIGYSYNPPERVMAMKTTNPFIILFATLKGNVEKEFHLIFKRKRVKGEWFKFKKEEIDLIVEACGFFREEY
ncbi:GIY-YIG nuclease family protein [Flagellimonas nanhaiensis]|uniref:Bacteriophage T5 Orf172 DNA-binding domain-containing protein n=1 Tax=Flagellimonas nanhaiensis TaxID=2292706 RepID=A0A371JKV7_9FLAO|nr:GIY-YIG nuclease family protein [Allomuricauda nanhaiensis]RDY57559.1 hypothetical protein DX873_18545 [Allomuricauda nanhaiensis]